MPNRWQALVVVAFACSAPAPRVATPIAAHAGTPRAPAALLDDALTAIRTRARVGERGAIRFEAEGAALDVEDAPDAVVEAVHVVAAQGRARVQLRLDGDDARLLVWVERADLASVVVKAHALVDPATGGRGAVVRPGAVVHVIGSRTDELIDVAVDDGAVRASGRMPRVALGTVYEERPPRPPDSHDVLAAGETVRAAPDDAAAPIATTDAVVGANALAPAHDGWVEIELDRPWLYARGFVRADAIAPDTGSVDGSMAAGAYAMSDTPTLILPSGACLFARPGGPVVGVNTAERLRYVHDADAPGWRRVAVETDWGLVWPAVHFPEKGGEAAGDFDRCPTRAPAGEAP